MKNIYPFTKTEKFEREEKLQKIDILQRNFDQKFAVIDRESVGNYSLVGWFTKFVPNPNVDITSIEVLSLDGDQFVIDFYLENNFETTKEYLGFYEFPLLSNSDLIFMNYTIDGIDFRGRNLKILVKKF